MPYPPRTTVERLAKGFQAKPRRGEKTVFWPPSMEHLGIGERRALLLHRRRPVLAVGPYLAETARNLRIAAREAFHQLFPARRQSLRLFRLGVFIERSFHVAE